METAMQTMKRETSTVATIFIWALRLIAAAILLQTLFFKFTGAAESVYIFTKIDLGLGIHFFEPWVRIGSGVIELIASILLLWPAYSWLGSLLAIGSMASAIIFHLTILGIEVQGDHGLLFALAWIILLTGGINLFIGRTSIPFIGERLG